MYYILRCGAAANNKQLLPPVSMIDPCQSKGRKAGDSVPLPQEAAIRGLVKGAVIQGPTTGVFISKIIQMAVG